MTPKRRFELGVPGARSLGGLCPAISGRQAPENGANGAVLEKFTEISKKVAQQFNKSQFWGLSENFRNFFENGLAFFEKKSRK